MGFHHGDLSHTIIGAAIEVHRTIGPGLLERVYRDCLAHELGLRNLEVPIDLTYKGLPITHGYRVDLLVEEQVVVEVKAIETVHPVHRAQLLTYLKLLDKRAGLLLNFNVPLMKDGVVRMAN